MADEIFANPELARLYDPLDPDRSDLDAYVGLVEAEGSASVLDVGCGTGALSCRLALAGLDVTGVDPAAASLDVARGKPGGDRVTWIHGDATTLPPLRVDAATMTGNIAQVFVTDDAWAATLEGIRVALRPDGLFVFETRIPERRAWEAWDRPDARVEATVPGVGLVEQWVEDLRYDAPLLLFRTRTRLVDEDRVLESRSTLRFRGLDEVRSSLAAAGFSLDEVRDAPDRPGLEWVVLARATG